MIPLSQKPKIIQKEENKAVFEMEALYPGYGLTIGNSLRRVLLSSLEGAAITTVKIKNVSHEFSTIRGVLEDVILILLNLKKLRFKMFTSEPQRASLKIKGEKEVIASDFKLPPQVEIVNKESHIATLTDKKAELEMEVQIEKKVGYEPVERRKKEKLSIGEIAVDAIYTPVKKVAFHVENMRVGERTDFDRLILELETDGTIAPQEAFLKACQTLEKHFSLFSETFKQAPKEKAERAEDKKPKKIKEKAEDLIKIKIEDSGISARNAKILRENNIKTLAGLVRKSQDDILAIKGMGKKGVKEIERVLKKRNLELKS